MWQIIASKNGDEMAILEKDGQHHVIIGSGMPFAKERKMHPMSEHEAEGYMEDPAFLRHDPPTKIEDIDDWRHAAIEYWESKGVDIPVPPAE